VLIFSEISPSPVHCPFWIFAAASLKLHVVLLNCSAQKLKLFRVHRAIALTLALAARVFAEHFALQGEGFKDAESALAQVPVSS
jgi:hypothetical protein